jgi:T5orf172 domain
MAKQEHTKAECPFCSWCKRAFHLPDHLITHHAKEIRFGSLKSDHCIHAFVMNEKEKIDFCVCLSCRKGALGEGIVSNSSRWVSLHSSKIDCKKAHQTKLAEFKDSLVSSPTPSKKEVETTTVINPTVSIESGYLYCFVNESMPGIVKVGMTSRTPIERLEEANSSNTWKPPTPYTIALAKQVLLPKQKEETIHKLLEKYTEKIHERREFFRVSLDEVRLFFDLMDGEYWENKPKADKKRRKNKKYINSSAPT